MLRPYARLYLEPNNMRERSFGDFQYLVYEKPKPKICFGSGLMREVLPTSGPCLSSFQRRLNREVRNNLGPTTYVYNNNDAFQTILHKPSSNVGSLPKAPRFYKRAEYQPPPPTEAIKEIMRQNKAPFNMAQVRKGFGGNDNPGPGTYCQIAKTAMTFRKLPNGRAKLVPAVKTKCVPLNNDACEICSVSCSQIGDYWQSGSGKQYLCRNCMKTEWDNPSKFSRWQLEGFSPIRDCFWVHKHENTKAGIRLMSSKQVMKKLQKEAYLCQYFSMLKDNKYSL